MSASLLYKQSHDLDQETAEKRWALQLLPRMTVNDSSLERGVSHKVNVVGGRNPLSAGKERRKEAP
ncbi:MAG: hypothetical protein ACT4O4_08280 [Nitrospiraceae bacterium]